MMQYKFNEIIKTKEYERGIMCQRISKYMTTIDFVDNFY